MATRAEYQPRSAKRVWIKAKIQLAQPYTKKEQQTESTPLDDTAVLTGTVYQLRSAKRKHIGHRGISTAISRAKAHLAQHAMISKSKIQLAQPQINKEQQAERTLGRRNRVDQIGISTAIS